MRTEEQNEMYGVKVFNCNMVNTKNKNEEMRNVELLYVH